MIEDLWYKNSIIYSLDLETFMDANGDGVGDFEGLMCQLDYLESMGIDTLWLAPFQPTPNHDNGYDVSDYYGVDPRHGSSGEFVEFMHQAHKRGMKVIIDLVVNHSSNEHRWFQEARKSKKSPYRDWYVWSKERPPNWKDGVVFPGVQESTWTYDDQAKEYYFHRFYEFQPDLNTNNPKVREEINKIMGYWLQLGVAGFRLDAVPFIIETPDTGGGEHEQDFEFLKEMRRFLQWRKGDAIMLGETNVMPEEIINYFGKQGDGIHMMFNFYVNQFLFYALATSDIKPLVEALEATRHLPPMAQWAQFLRNHDELDLGRLSDEQRKKVFEAFGPEKKMQLYDRGIRRRLAPMLVNRQQLEMAYSIVFSLPGTPVLRYGDEIGMGEDLSLKERAAVRTPMQWSDAPNAGFSSAKKTIHPVISSGTYSYEKVNVAEQRRDPDSLLNWTAKMIRLRKECPEIGLGNWEIIDVGSSCVLCMQYQWRTNTIIVLHNFDSKAHFIQLKLKVEGSKKLYNLLAQEDREANKESEHRLRIDAYGYKWFRVGALDYVPHY